MTRMSRRTFVSLAAALTACSCFLPAFFGLALAEHPPVDLASIPESAQREHFNTDPWLQLLTPYLLNEVFMSRRNAQDAAVLGITAIDLWPGPGWNHVERGRYALRAVITRARPGPCRVDSANWIAVRVS